MTSKETTRYRIPHPDDPGCEIVGDLEQVEPEMPTRGRKVALILHGVMGHKDYLFQRRLAKLLPMDSFRFDFRGNHETSGGWKFANFEEDLKDLRVVVAFLTSQLGYVIDLLVCHSRGSIVGFKWLCTSPEGANVTAYVNVAGRYRMERIRARFSINQPTAGYHEWKVRVAGKERVFRIFPEDVERFATWNTQYVWDQFPQCTHALTIHGLADETVPPYDAFLYARALSSRHPGTHNLHMIEDADHNFIGKFDEVNEIILEWLAAVRQGTLKSGIWRSGVKGKL